MKVTSEGMSPCSDADRRAAGCCRKSDFVAILAHELRHPLAPIRSGLDFLRSGGQDCAAVTKTLDMMARQVSKLTQLIDDLFDVVGISSGQVGIRKKSVDLNNVLWSAIETSLPVIEAAGHHLLLDIPDVSLLIELDPGRISQVVVNLLNNAAKYTPAGGCIELAVRQDEQRVFISVTDDGAGIAESAFVTIFDMFNQGAQDISQTPGGLGIGLSLVRQLVELHGGTVTVASPGIGQGSTFTVALPLPALELAQASRQSLRMLIVDDHADAAQMLAAILEMDGHKTTVVGDGHQALQVAQAFSPDMVFLDIEMPGLNGYETARALRKLAGLEQVTLVALTGWDCPKSRIRVKDAGFDHHLSKPTTLATVRTLVAQVADALAGS